MGPKTTSAPSRAATCSTLAPVSARIRRASTSALGIGSSFAAAGLRDDLGDDLLLVGRVHRDQIGSSGGIGCRRLRDQRGRLDLKGPGKRYSMWSGTRWRPRSTVWSTSSRPPLRGSCGRNGLVVCGASRHHEGCLLLDSAVEQGGRISPAIIQYVRTVSLGARRVAGPRAAPDRRRNKEDGLCAD